MQFVNMTSRRLYTKYAGWLNPGATSGGMSEAAKSLERVLKDIVSACGNNLGIRLSQKEAELMGQLMALDEKGTEFNPSAISEAIRKDPIGEKRADDAARAAQQRAMDEIDKANAEKMRVEREINGETVREPSGPAVMQGKKVEAADLKSGFAAIMEENAKIAAGEPAAKKNIGEILDPIGAHIKDTGGSFSVKDPSPKKPEEEPKEEVKEAKAGGAVVPKNAPADAGNHLDEQAARVANSLHALPGEGAEAKPKAKRGKAKSQKKDK